MIQPGLFDRPYPYSPGAKRGGTSQEAAKAMAPRARTLKEQVLALLREAALTADECATKLNVTVLACRPRLSELAKTNQIYDTGKTRPNASRINATVWRAHT